MLRYNVVITVTATVGVVPAVPLFTVGVSDQMITVLKHRQSSATSPQALNLFSSLPLGQHSC